MVALLQRFSLPDSHCGNAAAAKDQMFTHVEWVRMD